MFLADNTSVEWVIHDTGDGNYILGTKHCKSTSGSYSDYGCENTPVLSVHSHPNTPSNREVESMGYPISKGDPVLGDYKNMLNESQSDGSVKRDNRVYFPVTRRLYRVTSYKPKLISNKSNPKVLLKK